MKSPIHQGNAVGTGTRSEQRVAEATEQCWQSARADEETARVACSHVHIYTCVKVSKARIDMLDCDSPR